MITPLGSLTVGAAVPGCQAAVTAGTAGITLAVPDVEAKISAFNAAIAAMPGQSPINPLELLAQAQALVVSIQQAMLVALPMPSIDVQIGMMTAELNVLMATLVTIEGQLAAIAALQPPLLVAGVAAYAFDGALDSLPGELDAELAPNPAHANALVLITQSPAAWSAMGAILKVSA